MENAETMSSKNKRIAKNTLMLYARMFVLMGISLYTSRIILQILGVEDFGIYNLIGGIVVLFTFINNAMVTSTQRFLNFNLGQNNLDEAQKVFSSSLVIYGIITVIFIILAETIGLWALNNYLNIPSDRMEAANIVYQATILTTSFNFIRTIYNAVIIAYERMSFYAYTGIIEAVFKLGIVFILVYFPDKLISYAWLINFVSILMLLIYVVFCNKAFAICRYSFTFSKRRYKSLISFSGWNLFGSISFMAATQGVNILLNIFFGVTVNAAMGLASQVYGAIYQFVYNYQTAFNPQIIKTYASGDKVGFINLILNSSRYSYFLLFVLIMPCYICCNGILEIWLGEVPQFAVSFCRLLFLFSLIDAVQGPLDVSAQVTEKIRTYQILMGVIVLLNLPLAYVVLKIWHIAELALVVKVVISLLTCATRIFYLNHLYSFPRIKYLKGVVLRCLVTSMIAIIIPYLIYLNTIGYVQLIFTIIFSLACSVVSIYFVGLKYPERIAVNTLIKKTLRHHAV